MDCICNYCGKIEHDQMIVWNICFECQKRPDVPMIGKERPAQAERLTLRCTDCNVAVTADDATCPKCGLRNPANLPLDA